MKTIRLNLGVRILRAEKVEKHIFIAGRRKSKHHISVPVSYRLLLYVETDVIIKQVYRNNTSD